MLYAIFGVLVIILDQWVKYWTADNIVYGGEARAFIPGILNWLNVHNDGAAFSFLSGANARMIFVILAVVFTVLVIIGLATNFISGRLARWCAVFVAAGGISNAIDRFLFGYVQDMFQFDFAKSFPVFNVADVFISVFCILFILCILFGGRKEKSEADFDEEYDEAEDDRRSKRGRKAKKAAVEEEYEEEVPAPRKASRRAAAIEEYDEEPAPRKAAKRNAPPAEEAPVQRKRSAAKAEPQPVYAEQEDEPASPKLRNKLNATSHSKTTRKERQSKYDDQFEQYKANRDAKQRSAEYSGMSSSAPAFAATIPSYDSSDPFAEWEKANAAISAQKASESDSSPVRTETATPAEPRRTAPERQPAAAASQAPARREPAPASKPAPAPAQKPEPAPAAPRKSSEEQFSLDDILAEFK